MSLPRPSPSTPLPPRGEGAPPHPSPRPLGEGAFPHPSPVPAGEGAGPLPPRGEGSSPLPLVLVTGGVRSGKSRFAERYVAGRAAARGAPAGAGVVYVATAQIWDGEMASRVARHRASRPAAWPTVEAPLDLRQGVASALAAGAVVLVDSLDFWLSNRLLDAHPVDASEATQLDRDRLDALEQALLREIDGMVHDCRVARADLVVVTLEAGMGVVPPSPLGRAFRDLLGRANAALAAVAGRVFLLVDGLPVDVKRLSALTWSELE